MAGHNKWSKVKNSKGVLDSKRGKLYTKLTKEITVAARMGGGNADSNPRLRQAIYAARDASMPKDNIERALAKGTGSSGTDMIEDATYEGYGPGGAAIMVETTSDNKNRTVSELRNLFKTHGGHLSESGSVSWMFNHYGQLVFDKTKYPEDKVMEVAVKSGAQDVISIDNHVDVITDAADIYKVKEGFDRVGFHANTAALTYLPKNTVPMNEDHAKQLLELLEAIEDHDDVQRVHSNFEIDDKIIAQYAKH